MSVPKLNGYRTSVCGHESIITLVFIFFKQNAIIYFDNCKISFVLIPAAPFRFSFGLISDVASEVKCNAVPCGLQIARILFFGNLAEPLGKYSVLQFKPRCKSVFDGLQKFCCI